MLRTSNPPQVTTLLSCVFIALLLLLPTISPQSTAEATQISILASSSIRGNAFPIDARQTIKQCYEEEFDDPNCIAGCPRRVALTNKLRAENPSVFVVDTGGVFFGTLLYTLYGTEPFERCMEEIGYDVVSLGGSDLYVGLEVARLFFMSISTQTMPNNANDLQATQSNFDMYSQSIKLPNMMYAESFLHHNQISSRLEIDEHSKKLHDKLEAQFSSPDPATIQDRIVHQIQLLTYPALSEQTFYNTAESTRRRTRGSKKKYNPNKRSTTSHTNSPSTHNATSSGDGNEDILHRPTLEQRATKRTPKHVQAKGVQNTLGGSPQYSPATISTTSNPRIAAGAGSRHTQLISTNLNVTVSTAWKLIMRTSALLEIKGEKDSKQVAFLSILPDWYRASITNCPSWFQIGEGHSSPNHIRAEISRLKRLDIAGRIAAFVLLIQEDTNPAFYEELYQIEHVNVFVAPMPRADLRVYEETSIYGDQVVIARYKGESHVLSLTVDVDEQNQAHLKEWKQIYLDHNVVKNYELEPPAIYNELKLEYNPVDDGTVTLNLSRALSNVYGDSYWGDPADTQTGWTKETYGCRSATCPMGVLAATSLLATSDSASIALLNAGAIRGSWSGDTINLGDILRVFPFFNKLVSFNVTGSTIYKTLAHSIAFGLSARLIQSNLRWVYFPYYASQMVPTEGASIEDALQHVMDVSLMNADGTYDQIDPKKTYRLVTLSYLIEGNDGYERVLNNDTISDLVVHSDTLLTSVVNHLRKSKFVWTVSRDTLGDCLFNRELVPLPLADSTCFMAITNTTAAHYRPCPTQLEWCKTQQSYVPQKLIVQRIDDNFDTDILNNGRLETQSLKNTNMSNSPYTLSYDPSTPYLYSSPVDYYTQTYFPHIYEKTQQEERERQQTNSFYSQIPLSDQPTLLATQQIPQSALPKRYHTIHTGWADELILTGQLQFLNEHGTIIHPSSNPSQLFLSTADTPSTIELVPGVFHDPEFPALTDCASCSGYGFCVSEGICECSLGNESEQSTPTLLLGKPTAGLYQGIEMISGPTCSQVLPRYIRNSFTVFIINAFAIATFAISICSFVFIIIFRKHPVVKSSGFDMLLTMTIGGAIVSLGIGLLIYSPFSDLQRAYLKNEVNVNKSIVLGMTTKLRLLFGPITMCNLTLGLTLLGFITMFGAILAKSYRIHCIFNARTLHEIREFSNKKARWFLGGFIALQLVLLILIYFISPMNAVATKGDNQFWVDCNIPDLRYHKPVDDQSTDSRWKLTPRLITYIFLFFYNLLVLCLGIYLSLVTRNVEKSYNESTVLAIAVYNLVLCSIVFFIALSSGNPTFSKLLQVAVLAYGVVSTLLLMLGPKIKVIWKSRRQDKKEKEHDKVFTYDPMTLRIQALEREEKIESQAAAERTISTQHQHLATLIQHILSTKDEINALDASFSSTRKGDDDDDDDDGDGAKNGGEPFNSASEYHPLAPKSTSTKSRGYTISDDVQSIISHYQSSDPPLISNKGSLNTSPSNLSISTTSSASTVSQQEQRQSRLKSTFGYMSKLPRVRPSQHHTSNSLLTPMMNPSISSSSTITTTTTTTTTADTDLHELQPQPHSTADDSKSVLL